MTLAINHPTNNVITISSTLLDNFILSPSSYSKIEITGKINCSGAVTKTYSFASLITGSTDVRTNAGVETIVPNFFSATTFSNGVYGFEVALTNLTGSVNKDSGCLFVHGDSFCKLNCIEDFMYFYALQNSQTCSCNCSNLCDIYTMLFSSENSSNNCNC